MTDLLLQDPKLSFFLDLMKHYSLGTAFCSKDNLISSSGISETLSALIKKHLFKDISVLLAKMEDRTVYYYTDRMNSTFILFQLTSIPEPYFLVIGPYTTVPYASNYLMAIMEKNHFSSDEYHILDSYYQQLPHFSDDSLLIASVNTFAEQFWGGDNRYKVEIIRPDEIAQPAIVTALFSDQSEDISQMLNATMLEERYKYENQVLSIITQGQIHKLDQFLATTNYSIPIEMRLPDPLRNLKNYLIIFNTLLRKAAEQGGVHPIYINSISRDFFLKIELLHSLSDSSALQKTMMRKYCLLVHNHSMKNYSQLVQKTIILIDSDLTADLSLSVMANALNVNASYLSSHFHKETGQTLTAYVNNKRIEYAIMLLNTSNLQVQTIAQYCGISDINYFTRIFKKIVGMTPSQYRESIS